MSRYDLVTFQGEVLFERIKAYRVSVAGKKAWLAKSQIWSMKQKGEKTTDFEFKVQKWLAKKKGII